MKKRTIEVGIVGMALLLLLIFGQFKEIVKARLVEASLLFLTAILVNMGEAIYFAPGGIGLLVHVAIAVALVSAERHLALSSSINP
jgi:hypothetical protein